MQKKLIALAVASLAAGSAFAQSSVAISGWFSQGYTYYKATTPGVAGTKAENRLDDGRYSRIRFTGTEDLGGGLKAIFQLENRFSAESGKDAAALTSYVNGDTFVGLSSTNLGSIKLGRIDTYYNDGYLTEFSNALPFISTATLNLHAQLNGMYTVRAHRHNNQVRYETPNFSGFQGTVAYSFNPLTNEGSGAANGSKGDEWYLKGTYMNGPVYAGASYVKTRAEGGNAAIALATGNVNNDAWRLYGSYTFPFGLKIAASVDRTESDIAAAGAAFTNVRRTSWAIPVTYTFGQQAVLFTYGQAGKTRSDAGTVANSNAKMYSLGYEYNLSKRTSVGASYTKIDNNTAANYNFFLGGANLSFTGTSGGAAGQDKSGIYLGVNHYF